MNVFPPPPPRGCRGPFSMPTLSADHTPTVSRTDAAERRSEGPETRGRVSRGPPLIVRCQMGSLLASESLSPFLCPNCHLQPRLPPLTLRSPTLHVPGGQDSPNLCFLCLTGKEAEAKHGVSGCCCCLSSFLAAPWPTEPLGQGSDRSRGCHLTRSVWILSPPCQARGRTCVPALPRRC